MASDEDCAAAAPLSAEEVESSFQGALDALHRLLLLQEQLSTALRQGWFNLSLARYNLGPQRVGALQYPATMTATTTLQALSPAPGLVTLALNTVKGEGPAEAAESAVQAQGASIQAEGLRRRRAADEPAAVEQQEASPSGKPLVRVEHKQRQANALNWFGALVPPALRNAQQDFALALSNAVELANTISQLESFRKAYVELVKIDDHSTHPLVSDEKDAVRFQLKNGSMSPLPLNIEDHEKSKTQNSVDTKLNTEAELRFCNNLISPLSMGPVPPADASEPAEFSFSMAYSSPLPLSPSSPTPLPSTSWQISPKSATTPSSEATQPRPVPVLQSLQLRSSLGASASGSEQGAARPAQGSSPSNASAGPESIDAEIPRGEDAGPGTSDTPSQEPGPNDSKLHQLRTSSSDQGVLSNATSLGTTGTEGTISGQKEVKAGTPGMRTQSGAAAKAAMNRKKVPFEKGYSQMDWLRLTQTHPDLAGLKGGPRRRISMEEVKLHKAEDDCWTVLRGKVFNITPYFNFHPGGQKMLKLAAGKDCTQLFDKYHMWVNAEFLLEKCWLGVLDQGH
ncbi:hypothetical protein KFL_008770050 [Klebsormidium nitens]|uniref:Cytochrome b5 heme-binding domain-containing protein n=1 Tax=Klebsormidium nitens TaxID=105231 RepID=A0A1Y1IM65_KLENI|nr:hypothetical protein KFL_008770050 [Klebsormidium nitens]|eukprot:GAQ91894.1 hypothetical protein KFL_008770050 [Klebsormidium nitens]